MDSINVSELVERLGSDEDAVRKMAAFKLQSSIGDPSFADVFILEGGLSKLRYLVLNATGNTLAYSLTSFSRLLEVDKGWDFVNQDLIGRVVELVVTHPLVNILRGAMSILVCIVSRPYAAPNRNTEPDNFGFRALKPAIAAHPQFLEMLVSRLSSADHALCTNALQLINSLMREAITNDSEDEWPKFIRRMHSLGVIEAVYELMQSTALQDLSQPLLEFQALMKVLLRKWRDLPVDLEKPEHRRALKIIHAASNPEKSLTPVEDGDERPKKKHNPEKWRRLGFETEAPTWEFEEVGYLGMMDLINYVKKNEDLFQKQLLEQSTKPGERRCPIARASLAVTAILLGHFDVEKADVDDAKYNLAFESKNNIDKVFKPVLLQWSVLHTAGLQAFFRLWQTTNAETDDFGKIFDLVSILLEAVLSGTTRTKQVQEVESEIAGYELSRLRQLQMELLEMTYEETWGQHLGQIKDELSHEALQFVKEQRIRCLIAGAWFPNTIKAEAEPNGLVSHTKPFRYVKLSHNRRYLHYSDFETRTDTDPALDILPQKVDVTTVSSVTSNVIASHAASASTSSSTSTLKTSQHRAPSTTTKITIHGHLPSSRSNTSSPSHATHSRDNSITHKPHNRKHLHHHQKEATLLVLHPQTQTLASEWLDGLLMLLNQQPITNETNKLTNMIRDFGLKIRLLNVRFDEMGVGGPGMVEVPEMPGREGVDDEFWYDDFGG
ncbi:MAG: hypothetical protein Q9163_002050 [Psora crenata]